MSEKQKQEYRAEAARVKAAGEAFMLALRGLSSSKLEQLRASARAGICPMCSKHGFKLVAMHVQRAHGLTSRDLKDILGMLFSERLVSPEVHQELSERHGELARGLRFHENYRQQGPVKRFSNKAQTALVVRARALLRQFTPEEASERGRKGGRQTQANGNGRRTCDPVTGRFMKTDPKDLL